MTEMHLCKPGIGKHSTNGPFIKTVQRIAKLKQAGDKIDTCIILLMVIKILYPEVWTQSPSRLNIEDR